MSTDPICLVGAQRSGTTWMSRLMARRPEIAVWGEPRQVWSFGHWFRPDERLEARDATPRVVRYIRHRFFEYARRQGKPRFCEKTPSNMLRLPFVRAVFPEAKIVLIVRDGRSVVRSSSEIRDRGTDWQRIRTRVRETVPAPWDLLSFASRAPWILDKIRGRPMKYWGLRPPGWREWVETDPPLVAIAKAWAASTRLAVTEGRAMDPARFLEFRYEDMTDRPRETMQRVVDFLELARAGDIVEQAIADADPARKDKWRAGLDDEALAAIRPHLEPTLTWLGYAW
jgi:hypothetical protein